MDTALPTLDGIQLTSIAGVMAATVFVLAILKRTLGGYSFFQKIPIFVYVTVVALALTVFANSVGWLHGSLQILLWDALRTALAASGFYTWLKGSGLQGLGDVAENNGVFDNKDDHGGPTIVPVIGWLLLAASLCGVVSGCQSSNIPLFNPNAPAETRIYSGRELLTELYGQVTVARQKGWVTQKQAEEDFLPVLDQSRALLASAETLLNSGQTQTGVGQIEAAQSLLKAIRDQLEQLKRKHS